MLKEIKFFEVGPNFPSVLTVPPSVQCGVDGQVVELLARRAGDPKNRSRIPPGD